MNYPFLTPDSVSHASLSCNSCTKIYIGMGYAASCSTRFSYFTMPISPSFRRNDFFILALVLGGFFDLDL